MPCTPEAADVLRKCNVLIAPSVVAGKYELKETNVNWSPEDFESKLQCKGGNSGEKALSLLTEHDG
ncbi:hypothetical protein DCAR_0830904 [Daucus carota subsp. sativus]|uniref:Uncharacterized protein n=1 Tax=Daucus carota subsp. sativus TaxID=79200 RepID=A0A175YM22_DAUCS|nr:hypothetical protein DCAR_0830904 [Daucus carota subsp. sativus]